MHQHSKIALGLTFLLIGCAVGPDYHKPKTDLPAQWQSGSTEAHAQVDQVWWKQFNDPTLDGLIATALAGNYDLKIASARIAESRAARENAVGGLLPTLDAKVPFTREGNQVALPANNLPVDLKKPFDIYEPGFDASWELDIFGKNRRAVESATAELDAAKASRDASRISLLAEVARTYMDIRRYQAQLAVAEDMVKSAEKTWSLTEERFHSGNVAGTDVAQARALADQENAELPRWRNQLAQSEFAMDVLLGQKPGYTHPLVATAKPIPESHANVLLAAPARVIADRPDIRMAERKLASATAQQGVATAQFFPDVSINGFLGLLSTQWVSLFMANNKSWLFAPSATLPIFNYSKLTANLDAAKAQHREALLSYQGTIVSALSDVERSVTALTHDEEQRDALRKTELENQHVADVARQRYKAGITSFLEVLDAQRTLYASQSKTIDAEATASEDTVALYKSLGGGWRDAPAVAEVGQKGGKQPDKR